MPPKFDVHVFTVVRLKVAGVAAESPEAAIKAALAHPVHRDLDRALEPLGAEWAEEHSHFLVDVVGDEEFEQSRWFHSRDEPLLELLERLTTWATIHAVPTTLQPFLDQAQAALSVRV